MGSSDGDINIPEPRDEFRKARLSSVRSDRVDAGFESFRLAQNIGLQHYGAELVNKSEQEKKDILTVNIAQYISDIELGPIVSPETTSKKTKHEQEQEANKEAKRNKIFDNIGDPCITFIEVLSRRFPGLSSLNKFTLDKGILSLFLTVPPNDSIQILRINLTETLKKNPQGKMILDEKVLEKEIQGKTHQSLDVLRQSLETESFFDGAIVVSYDTRETAKKSLGIGLQAIGTLGAVSTLEYSVKRMMFRDEMGRMQEVDTKIVKKILKGIGDKTRINSLLLKVMQGTGRVYNSVRNGFTDITTLGMDRATEKVRLMKRADIEAGRTMTDAEFETEKARVISEIARTPRSTLLAKSGELIKGIPGKMVHYMFWGVFFQEYQKNSYDIANVYKGIAETGLFFTGAGLASRVAPGVWKMPASLIGGGLAILGGHAAGGAMGLDKKMWRMMPERVAGDGSKSVAGHVVSAGIVNDGADRINTDLGIPGTRGGAVLYNPLGKDGIMPNVDFARTHIDFGVDPREYLQSRIGGTDTHWNKRMDEYVSWSTDAVMRILWEYENKKGYFSGNNGDRTKLLRERLKPIFDSEDGKNKRNTLIVADCIDYITNKATKIENIVSRKEMISLFIGNYANVLKIDEASLKYDENLLERDRSLIDGQKIMYLSLLSPEKRVFAEKVFARLQKGDILVDGKITSRRGDMIGQEVQVWRSDKKELALYEGLIDDTTPVKSEWYDILGYKPKEKNNFIQKMETIDRKYGIHANLHVEKISETQLQSGIGDTISRIVMLELAKVDPTLGSKVQGYILGKTLEKPSPNTGVQIAGKRYVLGDILANYMSEYSLQYRTKDEKPTQGDVFVYLLSTNTEYREQKRYIDTQKSIGYANRWKLF